MYHSTKKRSPLAVSHRERREEIVTAGSPSDDRDDSPARETSQHPKVIFVRHHRGNKVINILMQFRIFIVLIASHIIGLATNFVVVVACLARDVSQKDFITIFPIVPI